MPVSAVAVDSHCRHRAQGLGTAHVARATPGGQAVVYPRVDWLRSWSQYACRRGCKHDQAGRATVHGAGGSLQHGERCPQRSSSPTRRVGTQCCPR